MTVNFKDDSKFFIADFLIAYQDIISIDGIRALRYDLAQYRYPTNGID